MKRFIEGQTREQVTLLPECLDDFVGADNPVRIVDAFVEELDLLSLGFDGSRPAATGRPAYHPAVLLKVYIYGLGGKCLLRSESCCSCLHRDLPVQQHSGHPSTRSELGRSNRRGSSTKHRMLQTHCQPCWTAARSGRLGLSLSSLKDDGTASVAGKFVCARTASTSKVAKRSADGSKREWERPSTRSMVGRCGRPISSGA